MNPNSVHETNRFIDRADAGLSVLKQNNFFSRESSAHWRYLFPLFKIRTMENF